MYEKPMRLKSLKKKTINVKIAIKKLKKTSNPKHQNIIKKKTEYTEFFNMFFTLKTTPKCK